MLGERSQSEKSVHYMILTWHFRKYDSIETAQ